MNAELLPLWGHRPAASITRREIVTLLDSVAERGPVMANRVLAAIRMIFNEGLEREFVGLEANPAHRIKSKPEGGRNRYLTRDEVGMVWRALEPEAPVTRAIFRVALLTAARIENVRSLRWDQVDDADVWHIPEKAFKGRREHLVPLSKEALAVLDDLRPLTGGEEYAFPGRSDGRKPYVSSTNSALERIRKRTKLPNWTIHDFRTSFRTHATRERKPKNKKDPAGLGILPAIADAVLGHKEASLGFDRYTAEPERYLLSEKREALKRWGAFVLEAVNRSRNISGNTVQ